MLSSSGNPAVPANGARPGAVGVSSHSRHTANGRAVARLASESAHAPSSNGVCGSSRCRPATSSASTTASAAKQARRTPPVSTAQPPCARRIARAAVPVATRTPRLAR